MPTGLTNEQYQRIIDKLDSLPTLPGVVARLVDVVNSPDSSADDAAKLIEKDPALTGKMLRLANSAFYGMPRSVSSVSSAVVILGFNTIKSLVLSSALIKMFPASKFVIAFERTRFWKHSIACGLAARTITRYFMNVRLVDPESAFCAGIMHDIGKLVFEQFFPKEYAAVGNYAKKGVVPHSKAESELLGVSHSEIGKLLADRWALPLDLEYAMVYHHTPQLAEKVSELVATVHLADAIAHQLSMTLWDTEMAPPLWERSKTMLGMVAGDYQKIVEQTGKELEKAADFFDIISQ